MRDKFFHLSDFDIPITLRCMHCEMRLPKTARAEVFEKYTVVKCPTCRRMTPFKLEATA